MRIENYLGFPTGLTGSELAGRAILQANKFGAHLSVPTPVNRLTFENAYTIVHLDGGETVTAKCLLIATGADYRRLGRRRVATGSRVRASTMPRRSPRRNCAGDPEVVVVGGGNSAGQAAVFLSGHARQVLLLIRGDDLYKNMSSYLAQRIEQTPNIELLRNTTIRRMNGDTHLGSVDIVNARPARSGLWRRRGYSALLARTREPVGCPPEIERDEKGFVRTGADLAGSRYWTSQRQPFLLETSRPGVFAAGDVRSGSVKRVASAVGEGRDGGSVRARVPEAHVNAPGVFRTTPSVSAGTLLPATPSPC